MKYIDMKLSNILSFILLGSALFSPTVSRAETVMINDAPYEMERLIERQIAPGATYLRLRFPDLPLNVNLVIADLTNPYLRVENSVANESAKGTEMIDHAAQRLSVKGHKAVAGQNANFWAVSSQAPDGKMFSGQTRNASIRNGKMVTECNMGAEMAFGGPVTTTGLMGVSYDKKVYVDYCQPSVVIRLNGGIALYTVNQCNKGVHPNEIGMYNSFYGVSTPFRPIAPTRTDAGFYQIDDSNDAVEVLLDLAEGAQWRGGEFIEFDVKEVRPDAGTGTLGEYDLALVGRGNGRTKLANLKAGDRVSLKYAFTFAPGTNDVSYPLVETAIGGNLLMMREGEVSTKCGAADYDSMTYPRSLYGTSADHNTVYMMVIDKSTDPVYGKSAGLNTWKAAQIAKHFGCAYMMQCDGGGSAEMYVTDRIVNKTTEKTPRAVANCLMLFDESPVGKETASLAFDGPKGTISLPVSATYTPQLLVYNEHGSLVSMLTEGYELICSPGLGTVDGTSLLTASEPVYGTITATYGGKSVTCEVSVGGAISGIPTVGVDQTQELRVSPVSAAPGEKVTVEAEASLVEVFTVTGVLVCASENSAGCHVIEAPSVPGLYIISALTSDGRVSTRLMVS